LGLEGKGKGNGSGGPLSGFSLIFGFLLLSQAWGTLILRLDSRVLFLNNPNLLPAA
jgi:hypothetical protein